MALPALLACLLFAGVSFQLWRRNVRLRRESFIRTFDLPKGLFDKLTKRHPHLTLRDCQLVSHGLRQFFLAHLKSGRMYVSMPSQVADDLWHEFILYTKNYEQFCNKAFGRFLHHTPAEVLDKARRNNDGIRRCWRYACLEENINPKSPTRLPLLFALDAKLNIAAGFMYALDCATLHGADGTVYCGADLSSCGGGSGCGGDSFSDSGSDGGSSDGGGSDGGGCGGGGCGGGD
ncbi:hypothetical protein GCM10027277_40990 [Pseudoduganella ginsengisoli]|uniref:Glycine-rich domain-containing protein-like n=1 Tax=Pseudoduganella ginsengisoli TaxID=1462440 RepID=A0A6L6PYP0_9BURK|nr:hypothetical protein [Pseudoduganella ginsengisoli]MTW01832.1 hypothetical protein [Pseudoduganella ginsengisoli]